MRIAVLVSTLVAALAWAGPAAAGCWATVGIAPPPAEVGAGDRWNAEFTVLQHGRNPLPDAADARPAVTIVSASGERRTFAAKPTDAAAGRYAANVVFPTGGTWRYLVHDGFTTMNGEPVPCSRTHTFGPVDIAAVPAGGGGSSSPPWALVAAVGALGAIGVAAVVAAGRRRRRIGSPAPTPAEIA
jgi:hypothetical protein